MGKYYLYFASHSGKYIRLAYSDNVEGPYKIYNNGTLKLNQTNCRTHIASPDIHIDNENKKINISNYSESDKQNIKKHASIIENEIKSNYVVSSESLLTERYSKEAILGLYKALALCYFSLADFEKISIVEADFA